MSEAHATPKPRDPIPLLVTEDKVRVLVPRDALVAPEVASWNREQFTEYLKARTFVGEIHDTDIERVRQLAQGARFNETTCLLRGIAPTPPSPGSVAWVPHPPLPFDHVAPDTRFMCILKPRPGLPGVDVHGSLIAVQDEEISELDIKIGKEFLQDEEGFITATDYGQAILDWEKNEVRFAPIYTVDDPSKPHYNECEFRCNVNVPGDLSGTMKWKVFSNLTVEGHFGAPGVEVHGDLRVDKGIQTNMIGYMRVLGNCRTPYVAFSNLGVSGNLFVNSGIAQSTVKVGGHLLCNGEPGAIQGSDIIAYGQLTCNRVGSHNGRKTTITMTEHPKTKQRCRVQIGLLRSGSHIDLYGTHWTQHEDAPYSYDPPHIKEERLNTYYSEDL